MVSEKHEVHTGTPIYLIRKTPITSLRRRVNLLMQLKTTTMRFKTKFERYETNKKKKLTKQKSNKREFEKTRNKKSYEKELGAQ